MSFVQILTVETTRENQLGLAQSVGLEIRNQLMNLPGFVSATVFNSESGNRLVATLSWDDAIEASDVLAAKLLPPATPFHFESFRQVDHFSNKEVSSLKLAAKEKREHDDQLVDEAELESFPASDPPAY